MGQNDDLRLLLAFLMGFVIFSLPLMANDTRRVWAPRPAGSDQPPPGPPDPYPHYQSDDNDPGWKFRRAITDGDLDEAERLYTASLAADPPVNLANRAHWHGSTPLFEAARSGHLHAAKWLIARGANADATNEWGESAANEAGSMGHWDIVWYLHEQGAQLTRSTDHAHSSLVLSAVRHRSTDALGQLQKRGVDLGTRHWNANTVLHEAARMGETAILTWLLEHAKLDVNATNDSGEGALAEAATMGHTEAMWKLIGAGASLGEPGSAQASSLFYSAVRHADLRMLSLMLERGAVNASSISSTDTYGRLPILEAVRTGKLEVLDWLLAQGVNVSAVSNAGQSALAVAAHEDHFHLLWRLVEAGADVHARNEHGGTALLAAVRHGHQDDALKLISAGLDVNQPNDRGDTPLTVAAARGDMAIMQMLLDRAATATPRPPRNDTPLIRAAKYKRLEALRLLLGKREVLGLHVDGVNRYGDTALLEACRAGSLEAATLLLELGANASHVNKNGMTALLLAAEASSLDTVKLLVSYRADVHARNLNDEGAIELSRWGRDSDELRAFFEEHGVKPPEHMDDYPPRYEEDAHDNPDEHEPPEEGVD